MVKSALCKLETPTPPPALMKHAEAHALFLVAKLRAADAHAQAL
jgi:hypothetical protein